MMKINKKRPGLAHFLNNSSNSQVGLAIGCIQKAVELRGL